MSSPLRPRRPQASQPSPATDMDLSSDDSTLVGDEYLYSHAELGRTLRLRAVADISASS